MGAAIDATGSLSGEISLNGLNATNHFQVDFTLTQPEPYLLTYNGEVGDPRPTSPKVFVPGFFLGPSAPGTLAGDPHITEFFTVLTYSGMLQPGSYELRTRRFTRLASAASTRTWRIGRSRRSASASLVGKCLDLAARFAILSLAFQCAPKTARLFARVFGTSATRS